MTFFVKKAIFTAAVAFSAAAVFGLEFEEAAGRVKNAKSADNKAVEVLRCAAAGVRTKEFVELGLAVCAEAMKEQKDTTRMYAVRALAELRDAAALPLLLEALRDSSGIVRIEALRGLGVLGDGRTAAALLQAAASADGAERELAVAALAKLSGVEIDGFLIENARKSSESLEARTAAMQALAERGAASAAPALLELARGAEPEIRAAACGALGAAAGPAAVPAAIELVKAAADERSARDAASALARILKRAGRPDAAVNVVAEAARNAPASGRVALLGALALCGGARAAEILEAEITAGRGSAADREEELLAIFENLGNSGDYDSFRLLGKCFALMDSGALGAALQPEAAVAYLSVATALAKEHPEEAMAALQKAKAVVEDKKMIQKADAAMGLAWKPDF